MAGGKVFCALSVLFTSLLFAGTSVAQVREDHIVVKSPAISGNIQGNPDERDVYVILPEGYDAHPARKYPVVYFLHGFGDTAKIYVDYIRPDIALGHGDKARDVILVFPDGYSKFGGSMYAASPVVGDFETYISRDVVDAVDKKYRTIARADGRGIAGHSMGGAGALRIAMKHPDVFSSIYAMSACCLTVKTASDAAKGAEPIEPDAVDKPNFYYAIMAAFAPNPQNPPSYGDVLIKDGGVQPLAEARVAASAPTVLVPQYVSALKSMRGIAIDVGDEDGLRPDNALLSDEMTRFGVAHHFTVYHGDHGNQVPARFASDLLPFFTETLSKAE